MLTAACRRGGAAALAAARRTVLAPLPEYEEVHFLVGRVVCGRAQAAAARLGATAASTIAEAHQGGEGDAPPGRCRVEALQTELVRPDSFFVAGATLSDHYGLATTFRVTVE